LEQRDLGNYKSDLHQIFRDGNHVGVDVQSGMDFAIGQGTLPWQPNLGAKSAEIGHTPSFLGLAFHSGWQDGKADGRVKSAEVPYTSYKNLANCGPLTAELTVMVWRPERHITLAIVLDYGAMTALCQPTQTDETLYTELPLKTCTSLVLLLLRIVLCVCISSDMTTYNKELID